MRHVTPSLVSLIVGSLLAVAAPTLHAQAAPPAQQGAILVLPFTAPSGANDAWIGKAVQQDLLTDLTEGTVSRVLAPASAVPAADQDAALAAARQAGASMVIYGQAQTTGKEVRLSGQVLDVNAGRPLAALKATGPTEELFHLEDALARQAFVALPRNLLSAQTLRGLQNLAARQAQPQQGGPQQQWPNGAYADPTLNQSNIYGAPQTQPSASATEPPVAPESQAVYPPPAYYAPNPNAYTYQEPSSAYVDYPPYTYGYSGFGYGYGYGYPAWGVWPFWGTTFFVSPGFFHHHGFDSGHDHHGNGDGFNHGGFHGNGSGFAHSGFGAGFPRGNVGNGGFAAGRIGAAAGGFHSGAMSGGIRGGFGGGAFRSAGAGGGFHGGGFSGGGGFHGGGGGFHGGGGAAGGGGHR